MQWSGVVCSHTGLMLPPRLQHTALRCSWCTAMHWICSLTDCAYLHNCVWIFLSTECLSSAQAFL